MLNVINTDSNRNYNSNLKKYVLHVLIESEKILAYIFSLNFNIFVLEMHMKEKRSL